MISKNINIKLPFYDKDDQHCEGVVSTKKQADAIKKFIHNIDTGEYSTMELKCLCGNIDPKLDVLLAEHDRYGIPLQNVLCTKCGLVRAKYTLDENSSAKFYQDLYRDIYSWGGFTEKENIENLFREQIERGKRFSRKLTEQIGSLDRITTVFEIGTGCGGNLIAFSELGKQVVGCDFNKDYLKYGTEKGLDLRYGDLNSLEIKDSSQDLIILSHVLEHFSNPVEELNSIIKKVSTNGYLIIEVPGILNLGHLYRNLLKYFQNAHTFNYSKKTLDVLFTKLNLEIICSDERCLCILRKPKNWTPISSGTPIYSSDLRNHYLEVLEYLKEIYILENVATKLYDEIQTSRNTIRENQTRIATLYRELGSLKENLDLLRHDNVRIKKNKWYLFGKYSLKRKTAFLIKEISKKLQNKLNI